MAELATEWEKTEEESLLMTCGMGGAAPPWTLDDRGTNGLPDADGGPSRTEDPVSSVASEDS